MTLTPVRRRLTPQVRASIKRAAKIVAANALLAGVTAGWTFITTNGLDLSDGRLAVVMSIGTPIILAVEKYLGWETKA